MRRIAIAALLALAGGASVPAAGPITVERPVEAGRPVAAGVPPSAVAYRAPVEPLRVLRGFEPPSSPYGPGHRGVDLAASPGQVVRAAGAGVVGFAGSVAGRGVVVIVHPDGVSTEYEPVVPSVAAGAALTAGEAVGRISGSHDGCPPGACLHWGARRGGSYFDPLTLLRALGRVRLLPWPTGPLGR